MWRKIGPRVKSSQGSVATRLRCDRIVDDDYYRSAIQSHVERILKIGEHLADYLYEYSGTVFTHSIYATVCNVVKELQPRNRNPFDGVGKTGSNQKRIND